MDDIHILCLSDIHYIKNCHENQEVVIREFFKDLSDVIKDIDRNNLYCIIAGDLVQHGNTQESYDDFYNGFLNKLLKRVDLDHIICTPGNHDLNRNILNEEKWRKKHTALLNSKETEERFNIILKDKEDSVIYRKFLYFDNFCNKKLKIPNYSLLGYWVNIIPEISVYCINSALLSNGGLDGFPKDLGLLRIETSGLYQWVETNKGRTKILVMHHPLHHLSEYIQNEVENILRKDVDILITGHLHRQNFKQYLGFDDGECKYCSSPQLYSDKLDQNGYSIMHFNGAELYSIEYRKWSSIHEKFTSGSEFTTTNNGIILFDKKYFSNEDFIEKELEQELNKSLKIYNYSSPWVDRKLSNLPPHIDYREDEIFWDHIDVVNSKMDLQIVGGTQFGLTCFARKTILQAWKREREHWLYINGNGLRLSKVQSLIDDFTAERNIESSNISTIVVDNWSQTHDNKGKILGKIKYLLSTARCILINNEDETTFRFGLNNDKYEDGFTLKYLRELDRKSIREITSDFIDMQNFNVENGDKMLERLMLELVGLNVHRTPVNCIQLLMNFKNNYESKPINRARILSSLLQFFFINPDSYFYTETIDEDDCRIIMGALCEKLMRNTIDGFYQREFSKSEFLKATDNIIQKNYSKDARLTLLQSMEEAEVIIKHNELYEFRFSYWVYFFTACQMYNDRDFYHYMIYEQKCIFMPDVIEFYTGIDDKCENLLDYIIKELNNLSNSVSSSLGVTIKNPYNTLKCHPNPILENKTTEQLENTIAESRLPVELKDAIADNNPYVNVRPYFQAIKTVMDKFNVYNMMKLSTSAARAIRNSNLVDNGKRLKLYKAIQRAWHSLFEVLFLLTPVLALEGRGSMGGANFLLTEEFDKVTDPQKKLIRIITAIPFNIINWFKNDVYSEKRSDIYTKAIESVDNDELDKHLSVLLIIASRPKGWTEIVRKYMKMLHKNSFYLGDMGNMLNRCFSADTMSKQDQNITKKLIIECLSKQKNRH